MAPASTIRARRTARTPTTTTRIVEEDCVRHVPTTVCTIKQVMVYRQVPYTICKPVPYPRTPYLLRSQMLSNG